MASVLLVDDEKEAIEALKTFFEMQGFTCWIAFEGEEAIKIFSEQSPDLVLLDVHLEGSGLDGLDVLKEIKKKKPDAKIFMITGYNDENVHAEAMELGAAECLEKPLSLDKLLLLVSGFSP